MLTSTRYGIVYPNPNRADSADVPRDIGALVTAMERSVMYSQGTLATRPTSTAGSPGIAGRMYRASDQALPNLYWDYGTGWDLVYNAASPSVPTVPLGGVMDWPWATADLPTWAVLSYGQLLTQAAYPAMQALADNAGRPYGGAAGTNFNTPDYRGRSTLGKDDMGGTAANRITVGISGINGTILGAVGGVEGVTLTTATIPAHNHSVSGAINAVATGISATQSGTTGITGTGAATTGVTTQTALTGQSVNGAFTGVGVVGAGDHNHALHDPGHGHTSRDGSGGGGSELVHASRGGANGGWAGGFAPGVDGNATGIWLDNAGTHGHSMSDPSHIHSLADPRHSHTMNDPTHSHTVSDPGHTHNITDPTHTHTHSLAAGNTGSGGAHPNVQPSIVVNKLVRVL